MKNLNDLVANGNPYFYSLKKLLDQNIQDIEFYFEKKNGAVLVIPTNIILEDGTMLSLEVDDFVCYLMNYNDNVINFEDDTIDRLYTDNFE